MICSCLLYLFAQIGICVFRALTPVGAFFDFYAIDFKSKLCYTNYAKQTVIIDEKIQYRGYNCTLFYIYHFVLVKMRIPLGICRNFSRLLSLFSDYGVCVFRALTPVGAFFDFYTIDFKTKM